MKEESHLSECLQGKRKKGRIRAPCNQAEGGKFDASSALVGDLRRGCRTPSRSPKGERKHVAALRKKKACPGDM